MTDQFAPLPEPIPVESTDTPEQINDKLLLERERLRLAAEQD